MLMSLSNPHPVEYVILATLLSQRGLQLYSNIVSLSFFLFLDQLQFKEQIFCKKKNITWWNRTMTYDLSEILTVNSKKVQ